MLRCRSADETPRVTDDHEGARPMPVQTSIQLFTVNAALEADLDETLTAVAARGFTAVEPYDFVRRAEPLAAALSSH